MFSRGRSNRGTVTSFLALNRSSNHFSNRSSNTRTVPGKVCRANRFPFPLCYCSFAQAPTWESKLALRRRALQVGGEGFGGVRVRDGQSPLLCCCVTAISQPDAAHEKRERKGAHIFLTGQFPRERKNRERVPAVF